MPDLELSIAGMSCGGCVQNVKKALSAVPGVVVEDVTVGNAVLKFDPDKASEGAVLAALAARGFPAQKVGASGAPKQKLSRPGGCCGG